MSRQQQQQQQPLQRTPTASFSSTAKMAKRSKGPATDPRIVNIRYHLQHPLTPRPLHFSRNRFLRHWTIHRAWMLFLRKRRWAEERELERQYMSMRAACEHLRLLDNNGNRVSEAEAGGQGPDAGRLGTRGREVGRLYRSAMLKRGGVG
ncbi:Ribosomal L28 L40 mitochondrial [Pyrenophora seminiperda CCB06]|uniref:Ribosomal L28 L40 mitochondrial n=1 Tax=Pyrenophora seminiperda CCB06 TaxID=1302712 RepID=A0A3M7MAG5_9PLEO|nr:Ribosomal L28 L40 mitochondrial [Pyrenophora seminiperda CCB06]